MSTFVPGTVREQEEMLRDAGYSGFEDMLSCIPEEVRLKKELQLPAGKSESEALRIMEDLAAGNTVFRSVFRGAGAYDHYIPAIVKSVVSKEEFVTSYTPYQAEISQGVLQSIFEYQTMMCELTGMDVANASHYDGATAAAESIAMCRDRRRSRAYVAATVNPGVIRVMETYCSASGTELVTVPEKDGLVDMEALREAMSDPEAACFYVQQPNYYGCFEDCTGIAEEVHAGGAKFIMGVDPIACAIIKTPGECGADICVGDGQPLGMPLSYGGPYLGFMTAGEKYMRRLPGRIVGETVDAEGRRAFVLTLQAREQHIRREKAGSNICSNQALCALTAAVYMAAMGPEGLRKAAVQSMAKAHYLQDRLEDIGLTKKYDAEFYEEFVTVTPVPAAGILEALQARGILGGLPLSENEILWCCTEKNSRNDIDVLTDIIRDFLKEARG